MSSCTPRSFSVSSSLASVGSLSGNTCGQSSVLQGQLSGNRRTDVAEREAKAERVVAFLRRVHPTKTAENVAADVGGSPETIRKMIDRLSAPSAVLYGRLVCAYGADFLAAVLQNPPGWIVSAARDQRISNLRAEQARLAEQIKALETIN